MQQIYLLLSLIPISLNLGIADFQSNETDLSTGCFLREGDQIVSKNIGEVWILPNDPCHFHTCVVNNNANSTEIRSHRQSCDNFTCNTDMELKPKAGTCCGECVKTKCFFNDTYYDIGQIWHNDEECTLLECASLANGHPIINAFQKTCSPLPSDCPKEFIHTNDCCPICIYPKSLSGKDIWTEEFYQTHPCVRNCQENALPMTCYYKFVVEWYQTLSKACYDCPNKLTDCSRPHCITGDGIARSVTVVNRMMPGPAIEVCLNDIIVVDVKNDLLGESTSIHWHGIHQKESPYMDGVPHITQCPILPHSTFRYTFKAENAGTHFWHSHTGMQRGDGVNGALIVRRPRSEDPHSDLYDFDLREHKIIIQDWIHVPGVTMFANHHHSIGDNKPRNILVNGKGRYFPGFSPKPKKEQHSETVAKSKNARDSELPVLYDLSNDSERMPEDVELYHSMDNASLSNTPINTPSLRVTSKKENRTSTFRAMKDEATADPEMQLNKIPLQIYNVKRDFRYRFRVINAEFLNCPVEISIDQHELTVISTDGYDFAKASVGSVVTYAGERFDFIVHANQTAGNYWIRFKGLMDCSEQFTSAFQVAILHYEGSPNAEPTDPPTYGHKNPGVQLNVMNRGPGFNDTRTIAELTGLPLYDSISGVGSDVLVPEPDYKFFVYYDFYPKDNPHYHPAEYYGFNDAKNKANRLYTPQLNHISLKFPDIALLPARYQFNDSIFCNETSLSSQGIDCKKEFCRCHHVIQVPVASVVELIIVDEGFTYDANHPFHLHGNAFRVVGLERLGQNISIETVKQLDRYKLLKRNLKNPPVKDTVTIPDGGYTILRFKAINPGFWLLHCHIEFHAEIGMALILKVGNNDQMPPVPRNFPTCHNYLPEERDNATSSNNTEPTTTVSSPLHSAALSKHLQSATIFNLFCGFMQIFTYKYIISR